VTRFLQVVDPEGAVLSDAYLALDDELIDYLGGVAELADLPAFARLSRCRELREWRIEAPERLNLANKLGPLAARVRERALPEPPAWVGLEGGTDIRLGEELGWSGLLRFLHELERLLFLAGRLRGELWIMEE
jgi:hypothetical protein